MELGEGITVRCGIGSKSVIADAASSPTSLKEFFQVFKPDYSDRTNGFGSKVTFYVVTFMDDVKYAGEGFFLCSR